VCASASRLLHCDTSGPRSTAVLCFRPVAIKQSQHESGEQDLGCDEGTGLPHCRYSMLIWSGVWLLHGPVCSGMLSTRQLHSGVNSCQCWCESWRWTLWSLVLTLWIVFFTALHVMQTRYSEEISVCPSVRPSVTRVIPDKRKKDLSRFLYHTKEHLS